MLSGLLALIVLIVRLAIVYWLVTTGLIALTIVVGGVVLRRRAKQNRVARIQYAARRRALAEASVTQPGLVISNGSAAMDSSEVSQA